MAAAAAERDQVELLRTQIARLLDEASAELAPFEFARLNLQLNDVKMALDAVDLSSPEIEGTLRRFKTLISFLSAYKTPEASLITFQSLLTELSNPLTHKLSVLAEKTETLPAALDAIRAVELSAMGAFHSAIRTAPVTVVGAAAEAAGAGGAAAAQDAPDDAAVDNPWVRIHSLVKNALDNNKKIFLVGCGASGRMAVLLEHFIRTYFPGDERAKNVIAILGGGDGAMLNALPQFEDDPAPLKSQLEKRDYAEGDVVIGFSASGSARAVLAAVARAGEQGLLVNCNDAEHIKHFVDRHGEKTGSIRGLKMPDGALNLERFIFLPNMPPAVAGSTRMHPTSLMMLACQSILGVFDPSYRSETSITNLIKAIEAIDTEALSKVTNDEAEVYKAGNYVRYQINGKSVVVTNTFTDLTERGPTFNLPRLFAILSTAIEHVKLPWCWPVIAGDFWKRLLGREYIAIDESGISETQKPFFENTRFGDEEAGYYASAVGERRKAVVDFTVAMDDSAIVIRSHKNEFRYDFPPGLNDWSKQLLLKIILNMDSTAIMSAKRLVKGNWMTNFSPSNEKLIGRLECLVNTIVNDPALFNLSECGLEEAARVQFTRELIREHLIVAVLELSDESSVVEDVIRRCVGTVKELHPGLLTEKPETAASFFQVEPDDPGYEGGNELG